MTAAALVGAAGLGSGSVAHAGEAGTGGEPVAPARAADGGAAESKLRLLDSMLASPGTGGRLERSESVAVRERLASVRSLRVRAGEALEAGRAAEAETAVNLALKEMGAALRLAGNPEEQREAARRRASELVDRVAGFRDAYRRVVAEKSRSRGGTLDEGALDEALERARHFVRDDRSGEAVALLTPWGERLETELTRLREKQTLVHELRFDSPEAEYAYERGRNHSYELLVGIALKDGGLAIRVRDAAMQAVRDNEEVRARADAAARDGAAADALHLLEQSTGTLIQMLRSAGMPIP